MAQGVFDSLQHHPVCLLNDLPDDLSNTIVYLWNFLHQQREVFEIDSNPLQPETNAPQPRREEHRKKSQMDISFKSIMTNIYHAPAAPNSLAIRLFTYFIRVSPRPR